jgi:hypothetical protein
MPKIRLSALATDMKGKAGGSVFSTNSGGVYFRNNPSGTSSKKPSNGLRKQMFATLAQSWKQLTDDEMTAWADAGPLYPTTNAWGESRIPKGFELYMRLNMNLMAAGEPILSLPLSPRSIPTIDSAVMSWTDEFQLIPTSFFACQALNDTSVYFNPTITNYLTAGTITTDTFFSFRTNIRPTVKGSPFNPSSISLLSILDATLLGLELELVDLLTVHPIIRLTITCTAGSLVREYAISQERLNSDFHISYQLLASGLEDGILYLDGAAQAPNDTVTGVLTADVLTADLCIWPPTNPEAYQILFSDFRIYNAEVATETAKAISFGYVFADEYILIPMNVVVGNDLINYTTAGDAQPLQITGNPPLATIVSPYNPRLLPNISMQFTGAEDDGFMVKFLTTQFQSPGRADVSSTYKKVDGRIWDPNIDYDVDDTLPTLLYSTINNTVLRMRAQLLDTTTGAIGVPVDITPNITLSVTRFKAGAELSGKVN